MKFTRFVIFVLASFLIATPAMAAPKGQDMKAAPSRTASAGKVEDALSTWKAAVESADVDAIMKLYDRDAIMISTFMQKPMTKRAQIRDYYKRVVGNPDINVTIEETHPRSFGDIAIDTGRYTLSYTQDGEPVSIPARFSFTYIQKDGKWVIVDHHSSRVPLPEEMQ